MSQQTMEFAWESWEPHFREKLIGLDNLSRSVFYDLQQDRIPNAQIQSFLADKFARLWESVAQEQEERFGVYRWRSAEDRNRRRKSA